MQKDKINTIGCMDNTVDHTFESANRVYDSFGICPTIPTCGGGGIQPKVVEVKQMNNDTVLIKQATKEGCIPCEVPGIANLTFPDSKTRRGRVIDGGQVSPTLTTETTPSVLEKFTWNIDGETYLIRIRKLTPKECWRLMGFGDSDFEKAETENCDSQLYKQAGNSIVVDVLENIFRQLL